MKYLGKSFFYAVAFLAMLIWHLNFKIAHREAKEAADALKQGDVPGGSF